MDMAAQLGINGIGEGTVILAETQDKGRGRLGREWFSPKYKGLYLSILLRPRVLPSEASILTLLVAVSICEAIKEVSGIEPQIKWPNDILVHNRKLGGILTEINAETDKINFVTIGIGINVNNEKRSLISGATSLKEIRKEEVSRIQLLRELLRRIEANYLNLDKKGSFVIAEKWRQHSMTLGKRVRVYCQSRQIEGEALDIENDGSLLLRKDSGITVKVTSGDVVHCR
jgi:BirA family biotin operon repressor/biotin-[acetyl-CoA-carboxylase] ligase